MKWFETLPVERSNDARNYDDFCAHRKLVLEHIWEALSNERTASGRPKRTTTTSAARQRSVRFP